MKRKDTTYVKKLASVLMLAVFLFMHTVKIFHIHESADATDLDTGEVKVEKLHTCFICDYHLVNHTYHDTPPVFTVSARPQSTIFYAGHYSSRIMTCIGLAYSDRGPPVMA